MNQNLKLEEPTDDDKKRYLEEHFFYEVRMLMYSFEQLTKSSNIGGEHKTSFTDVSTPGIQQAWESGSRDILFLNMALETFLLHARNLREFFYGDRKRFPDDARSSDFSDLWETLRPKESMEIERIRDQAGEELAHLTYKRMHGTPPGKEWSYRKIFSEFLEVIRIFLKNLPEKYFNKNLIILMAEVKRFPDHA